LPFDETEFPAHDSRVRGISVTRTVGWVHLVAGLSTGSATEQPSPISRRSWGVLVDSEGRHHPFEVLDHDGERVEVDAEIVPLVELIWSHGLDTVLSCQDQDGGVWVELPGRDAQRLLRLVAAQDEELRANILGLVPIEVEPDDVDAYKRDHCWDYRTLAVFEDGELWLSIGLRFPRAQLPAVVAALAAVAA
jgi:hypothetical protein